MERMSGEGILYFFEKQLVPEIQQLTLYALVFLILKTTLKCHYASSILQMRKQSRVVKGQGHFTPRATQLADDGAGKRTQIFMAPNSVLYTSKMQASGFLVNPLSLPELWIIIPSLLINTWPREVEGPPAVDLIFWRKQVYDLNIFLLVKCYSFFEFRIWLNIALQLVYSLCSGFGWGPPEARLPNSP